MNSWMSRLLRAWAPPFRMLSIGTGMRRACAPPKKRYSGFPSLLAAARAAAMDTAKRAFAPRRSLLCVPSSRQSSASTRQMSLASQPRSAGAITVSICATACRTPLPPKRAVSPSRSSRASNRPVDAPLGTIARPTVPSFRVTSASTVGFARESSTSNPRISRIAVFCIIGSASQRFSHSMPNRRRIHAFLHEKRPANRQVIGTDCISGQDGHGHRHIAMPRWPKAYWRRIPCLRKTQNSFPRMAALPAASSWPWRCLFGGDMGKAADFQPSSPSTRFSKLWMRMIG